MSEVINNIFEKYIKDIVFIVGITVGVVLFIIRPMYEMRQEIALQAKDINIIQTNHLSHIQESLERLEAESMKNAILLAEIQTQLKILIK